MAFEQYENEDHRIQEKLKQKTWNEIRTNDSWAIFKIMSEFVNGYESMARIGPCVSIFGSARTKPDTKYYLLAEKIAYKIRCQNRTNDKQQQSTRAYPGRAINYVIWLPPIGYVSPSTNTWCWKLRICCRSLQ